MVAEALREILAPAPMLAMIAGVVAGTLAGALPGVTATMSMALLVPYTFGWTSDLAAIMILVGIYVGAMYGGAIPAILIHTPGTPAAAATCFDGYPMARQGKAGLALSISCITGVVGGLFSAVVLVLVGPLVAEQALKIGPADYFALCVFGLSIVGSVAGKSLLKGLIMGAFGVLLATVGQDPAQAYPRFTFGIQSLADGFEFIPLMIGVFALAEAIHQVAQPPTVEMAKVGIGRILPKWRELKQVAPATMIANVTGTVVGAVPGTGGDIASFVAYDQARRFSKHPEHFGKGSIEGLAAAECANNSITGGAMIPMLSLGIPGDACTAVMLAALYIHNLRPGPMLFAQQPDKVGAIFAGLIMANIIVLPLGVFGARLFARTVMIPAHTLWPAVVVLCLVGAYALRNSLFDVGVALVFGAVGCGMKRLEMPPGPLVLGLILGRLAEENLATAIQIAHGSALALVRSPLSIGLYMATAVVAYSSLRLRKGQREQA